jgi:hypothetical protein
LEKQSFANGLAVISLVGRHQARLGDGYFQQRFEGVVIGDLAAGQEKAERASLTVCSDVDFARKAAAASKPSL